MLCREAGFAAVWGIEQGSRLASDGQGFHAVLRAEIGRSEIRHPPGSEVGIV